MVQLERLMELLEKEAQHHETNVYNYAIPNAWNFFGYSDTRSLRSHQQLVNPYTFYHYTLSHLFLNDQGKFNKAIPLDKGDWLKKASIYSLHIRSIGAWDHDRDDHLESNLYHLKDHGTFLKAILLLVMYKRMGINTILLHQPFALGRTNSNHEYANKECIMDFRMIAEELKDPIIPQMSAKDQCIAFIEACHQLGMRVILEYCPGKISIDNLFTDQNPDYFYWIDADTLHDYHAPIAHGLPQNTLPFTYTLKDFYKSEDVLKHIHSFVTSESDNKVIAPTFSDQINANLPIDTDATVFRFYEDFPAHVPQEIKKHTAPYLTQDIMRSDLYPGKKPMQSVWNGLVDNILWYQDVLGVDGIYLEKPYLLPEKLQKEMAKTAKKHKKAFAMIAEDTIPENSTAWLKKGFDMISGNAAYEETQLAEYKFHSFAYQLKGNACPMLAASEFYDSRRCSCLSEGFTLTNLLSVMNLFLPNGIPMYMSGIETYEVSPMQLSEYGDQKYTYCLPKNDVQYHKQSYIDLYQYKYTHGQLSNFISMMEKASELRKQYLSSIINVDSAIPVWFDSPQDRGIGFTFIKEDKALMVVCNTDIHQNTFLHIHTENLLGELGFTPTSILQVYSTHDPYTHDVVQDAFQQFPMDFASGEVKFIELKK